jgi:hypothetical protein
MTDCATIGTSKENHDWMIGAWNADKIDGSVRAVAYFEYVPPYICRKITDTSTKSPFVYKQLLYYYFRIIAKSDRYVLKADLDCGWLGPFIGKITTDEKICVLTDDTGIDKNGFELLPRFPIGDGTSKKPGFIPDPNIPETDPMYLKKGKINVSITVPIFGNNGGPLNYNDLYDGKWWNCSINNDDKVLTFTLETDWLPDGTGTLTATAENNKDCADYNRPISDCYPSSVYSNSNQVSETSCAIVDNLSWKIYVALLSLIFLIILVVLLLTCRRRKS